MRNSVLKQSDARKGGNATKGGHKSAEREGVNHEENDKDSDSERAEQLLDKPQSIRGRNRQRVHQGQRDVFRY